MNRPDPVMRAIRAHHRLMAEEGATWPPELQRLAQRKLLALKTRDSFDRYR